MGHIPSELDKEDSMSEIKIEDVSGNRMPIATVSFLAYQPGSYTVTVNKDGSYSVTLDTHTGYRKTIKA